MTKTFREVIRDIKEGETWVCGTMVIKHGNNYIDMKTECDRYAFSENELNFKLQRPEYTFTEAFSEYERGIEIESVDSGERYLKRGNSELYLDTILNSWELNHAFTMSEIRNKWYINKEVE